MRSAPVGCRCSSVSSATSLCVSGDSPCRWAAALAACCLPLPIGPGPGGDGGVGFPDFLAGVGFVGVGTSACAGVCPGKLGVGGGFAADCCCVCAVLTADCCGVAAGCVASAARCIAARSASAVLARSCISLLAGGGASCSCGSSVRQLPSRLVPGGWFGGCLVGWTVWSVAERPASVALACSALSPLPGVGGGAFSAARSGVR